jgi:hypothetical protein
MAKIKINKNRSQIFFESVPVSLSVPTLRVHCAVRAPWRRRVQTSEAIFSFVYLFLRIQGQPYLRILKHLLHK